MKDGNEAEAVRRHRQCVVDVVVFVGWLVRMSSRWGIVGVGLHFTATARSSYAAAIWAKEWQRVAAGEQNRVLDSSRPVS